MALQVNIRKKFTGFELNVEFETDGGCMGILGASGCGKSMTLKCVAGIEKPDHGRIVLNGKVLFDSEKGINLPARERRVGYLFQNYALFPTMTVEENLAIVLPGKKKDKLSLVAEQLGRFQLEGLEKRYPSQLSGGQQQRVAIARALAMDPKLLLMDEPTSALDPELVSEVLVTIKKAAQEGNTILLVTHEMNFVRNVANRIIFLENGKIVADGTPKEIFDNPKNPRLKEFLVKIHMLEGTDYAI